jgi:hypothetical protein
MGGYHPKYKGSKARKRKNLRADDELRKRLENISEKDMKIFDKALEKAIKSSAPKRAGA